MISEYYGFAFGCMILLISILIMYKRKLPKSKVILIAIFIIYLTGVFCLAFFPVDYMNTVNEDFDIMENCIKLIPFDFIKDTIQTKPLDYLSVQLGGNILMTIPFGIMLPMIFRTDKKWLYLLYSLGLTVFIEIMQFVVGFVLNTFYRTTDIDDIILNFSGAVIGLIIYKFLPQKIKKRF